MLSDRLKEISQTQGNKQMNEDIELIQMEARQMMQLIRVQHNS
jgi:hypothetical protein